MAAENKPTVDFDDLEPVESPAENDDDVPQVKLSPGENIVGEIREVTRDLPPHGNTLLHIARGLGDVVKMWSNGQIDRKLDAAGLEVGDLVGIRKTERTESYVDDDGEEQEFYIFEVRSLDGGD